MPVHDRYGTTSSTGSQPTVTRTVTKSVVPASSTDLVDPDVVFTKKHEEWTTSKRVVNHKTKQVETRVQRQLVLEDGRVIADSGPQVTTKTKEDVRVEESENTNHKSTGDDPPGEGYELVPGSAKVISEKTETNQTMTETREENRQMHDDNIRELSGEEIHQRTIISPDDPSFSNFNGKLTHYSSRSQKIVDKDEVKETSELKDGEVSTETVRTHHHEEAFDDEVPEEEAEEGMVPERSGENSRTIQYYTDPKEFENVSQRVQEESRRSRILNHRQQNGGQLPISAHRWVDDHFGPKEITAGPADSRGESTRTKSGGNRITIEMSGHRSSPSDLSPRNTLTKDRSRDSTLRNHRPSSSNWHSPSPPYPPSTPVHHNNTNTLGRSTASPFEVSSSSGSSRSKTPVKTYYLGEDSNYNSSWKKKSHNNNNHSFTDMSSAYSVGDTNSLGRSNLSGHYGERSDSFYRVPKSKISEPIRYETFNNGAVYSKVNRRVKTDKNVQVSMSDDDRSPSPPRNRSSTTTLPRMVKIVHETKSAPYSTLSHSKYYKSTDSLHSPSYYDSSYRNSNSSPIYNNSSFHSKNGRNDNWGYHNNNNNDTYSKTHEVKINKKNHHHHHHHHDVITNGTSSSRKGGRSTESPNWYSSSSLRTRKIPTSPPESGYQSPFPPTPPSSPPPRVIKVDHYGSTSSMSPPESPLHHNSTASIRKKSAYPSGSATRSKSSSDLRMPPLFSPESFTPLSSPLKLKNMGNEKSEHQKFYRVKSGQDGQSVRVQVRDWSKR